MGYNATCLRLLLGSNVCRFHNLGESEIEARLNKEFPEWSNCIYHPESTSSESTWGSSSSGYSEDSTFEETPFETPIVSEDVSECGEILYPDSIFVKENPDYRILNLRFGFVGFPPREYAGFNYDDITHEFDAVARDNTELVLLKITKTSNLIFGTNIDKRKYYRENLDKDFIQGYRSKQSIYINMESGVWRNSLGSFASGKYYIKIPVLYVYTYRLEDYDYSQRAKTKIEMDGNEIKVIDIATGEKQYYDVINLIRNDVEQIYFSYIKVNGDYCVTYDESTRILNGYIKNDNIFKFKLSESYVKNDLFKIDSSVWYSENSRLMCDNGFSDYEILVYNIKKDVVGCLKPTPDNTIEYTHDQITEYYAEIFLMKYE